MQCCIQNFKHLSQVILKKNISEYFCLACEAEVRHMHCFSGVVVVGFGGVSISFCRVFVLRSFSHKLQGLEP